jgi:phosphoribosylamine-glycine ligase
MRVLVIGNGGRERELVWKLSQIPKRKFLSLTAFAGR